MNCEFRNRVVEKYGGLGACHPVRVLWARNRIHARNGVKRGWWALYKRLKIGEKVLPEGLRKSCRKVLPGGHCGKSFPEVIVSGASCLESPSRRSLVRKVLPGGHCLGGFLPGESFPEVIIWRSLSGESFRRVLPGGLRKSCRKVLPGGHWEVLPGGHCLGG
jgi:hypothetical protein